MDNFDQIEDMLRSAPKFRRSEEADKAFYKALHELADAENAEAEQNVAGISWFKRLNFGFVGSLIVFIAIIGTAVMAYQPTVTRGDFLYLVKQTLEEVELAVAFSPMSKMSTHLQFADRRLEEAKNILNESPALAWLVEAAKADDSTDEIKFDSEKEKNFTLTLSDMSNEIGLAENIVGEKIFEPETAQVALQEIQTRAEKHLAELEKFEQKVPQKIKVIVINFKNGTNSHIARTVEANEEVNQAFAVKAPRVNLVMLKFNMINMNNGTITIPDPAALAQKQLQDAVQIFNSLPMQRRDAFQNKIEMAKEALQEGKVGRAEGLSRAMQNQMRLMMEQQQNLMQIMQEQNPQNHQAANEEKKVGKADKREAAKEDRKITKEIQQQMKSERKETKSEKKETKSKK